MKKPTSVDEYIASYPANVQAKLNEIRQIVKEEAPQASEKLSYGMPYFSFNGRLLYFAVHKEHIGLYAMPSAVIVFKKELTEYETSKGTIRFPLDKPLPTELIRRIIEFRVKENSSKKK
jgi:uncharacterized protein YdhG (YjbR/CyaY superfamily)